MDPGGQAAMGFVNYVYEVARGLGVCSENPVDGIEVEFELLTSAYIALPCHAPTFPTYDLALVWDEESGWAVAIETDPDLGRRSRSAGRSWSPSSTISLRAGNQGSRAVRCSAGSAMTMIYVAAWLVIAARLDEVRFPAAVGTDPVRFMGCGGPDRSPTLPARVHAGSSQA
ncbi:DUF6292 family protein [Saccharopolyspora pogona]|uniref:DUF6292 family protein n=1 Tax=Saccharopolyspora pogona TaxID=333966 RepID=UPI001686AFBE|nr:DUF6292 family protein [Saccharopolyspora pogona]